LKLKTSNGSKTFFDFFSEKFFSLPFHNRGNVPGGWRQQKLRLAVLLI